jgi:hypothetical protein
MLNLSLFTPQVRPERATIELTEIEVPGTYHMGEIIEVVKAPVQKKIFLL